MKISEKDLRSWPSTACVLFTMCCARQGTWATRSHEFQERSWSNGGRTCFRYYYHSKLGDRVLVACSSQVRTMGHALVPHASLPSHPPICLDAGIFQHLCAQLALPPLSTSLFIPLETSPHLQQLSVVDAGKLQHLRARLRLLLHHRQLWHENKGGRGRECEGSRMKGAKHAGAQSKCKAWLLYHHLWHESGGGAGWGACVGKGKQPNWCGTCGPTKQG